MGLETTAEVDTIEAVEDRDGAVRPPANADEQAETNDRLGNFPDGVDGDESDDATGSTLPDGPVPEGVDVVVQAQFGNESRIRVGLSSDPTMELRPGQSITYRVQDTGQIHIRANNAGDGVNYTHEGE